MKTIFTLIIALLISAGSFAQNGINYKAIVKDGSGTIVANDLIAVQLQILEGAALVYSESHNPTTDENGLVILNIGEGTPISGTFGNIDWADDDHFLNVQINTGGGFVDMGTTQFKSVPYAISSDKASNMEINNLTNVSGAPLNGEVLKYNGTNWVPGADEGVWSLNGNNAFYTAGRVGVGVNDPADFSRMHVGGDLFIQTNLGELIMGFPGDGNRWQFSTTGLGATLQLQSKIEGSNTNTTRFKFEQTGEFKIGDTFAEEAWFHVEKNSTTLKPHILMEEIGNDFSRIAFRNTTTPSAEGQIAGNATANANTSRLNFFFRNASGSANRMVLEGNGYLGINGTPSARLHVFQGGQNVGTGLAFNDGTANADWNVTHGFGLRFHYGNTLKGFISATTGAYVQSSDARLKENIREMNPALAKVMQLRPTSYNYEADTSKKQAIGVIAQEVQNLFPEVVHYSEADDTYGVDYAAFGVIAIKAIQEQQKEIVELKERLTRLQEKINR